LVLVAFGTAATAQTRSATDRQARAWAAGCSTCHGTKGESLGAIPAIPTRDAEALYRILLAFKTGQLPASTVMHQHTKGYTDDELKRIARHYASQPAQ
jgi:cytochrome c553